MFCNPRKRLCVVTTLFAVMGTPLASAQILYPVSSRNGLGIGLYQVARQARQWGYELTLTANRPHDVAFDLKPL